MRAQALLAGLVLLSAGCGTSDAIREGPTTSWASAVAGAADSEARFSGVLGLLAYKGELAARCTATLLAPNLVLTARHCVAFDDGQLVTCGERSLGTSVVPSDVFVTTLTVMNQNIADYVAAAEVIPAPGGDDTCGFDLAAVRLLGPPPGIQGMHEPRLDEPVAEGESFTAVGYGSTASFDELGTRRYLEDAHVACAGTACPLAEVQPNEWLAEDAAFCRADSGGAALDSEGRLIGTVSRGQNPCSTPILAALPPWKDWLVGVAQDAAEAGGYEVPAWANPDRASGTGGANAAGGASEAGEPAAEVAETHPALKSSCAFAAPEANLLSLFWLGLLLSATRGRRWAGAGCGRAPRDG